MILKEVEKLADELFQEHHLNGWRFQFDNSKRRFGQCRYTHKVISMSKPLAELNEEARVKNNLLHEMAHALVGHKHHHNYVWKSKAKEIGCDANRCYDGNAVITPKPNWIGTCPNNHTHKRHRTPRNLMSCSLCCPKFNKDYAIVWKKNS